ncbi:MAG: type IV pilus biogenesis/stability protein PilW [Planctomycetota bacterium]
MTTAHFVRRRIAPALTGLLVAIGLLTAASCKPRETTTANVNRNADTNLPTNFDTPRNTVGNGNITPGINNNTSPVVNNDAPPRNANTANTAPPPDNNTAVDSNTNSNSGDNQPQTRPSPGPLVSTPEEKLRERVASLTMDYAWPQGMYPFGLRRPAAPDEANDENVLWKLIFAAHATHRRGIYKDAEGYLEFALARDPNGDSPMVAFNLGACRLEMSREAPEKLDGAVDAFKKCLAIRIDGAPDAVWPGAAFRHFAAGALARIEMSRGNRRDAINYAITSVVSYPPEDVFTGRAVPLRQAAERILTVLYSYAGATLGSDSLEARGHLITDRMPTLSVTRPDVLTADFLISCIQNRRADDATNPLAPGCYRVEFLRAFATNWLEDFPDSDRRRDVERAVATLGD